MSRKLIAPAVLGLASSLPGQIMMQDYDGSEQTQVSKLLNGDPGNLTIRIDEASTNPTFFLVDFIYKNPFNISKC